MANTLARGLSRDAVEEMSRQKGEPAWMLQKRLHAWDVFESTAAPLGRRGDLGTFRAMANSKYQEVSPYIPADGSGTLPAVIQQSLQDALVNERAGHVVQRNASVVHVELDEELKRQGVILTDLDTAVREYPELVQQYFMTKCVPVESNKYTSLHAAFWSGDIVHYISTSVQSEQRILSQFGLDSTAYTILLHTL